MLTRGHRADLGKVAVVHRDCRSWGADWRHGGRRLGGFPAYGSILEDGDGAAYQV